MNPKHFHACPVCLENKPCESDCNIVGDLSEGWDKARGEYSKPFGSPTPCADCQPAVAAQENELETLREQNQSLRKREQFLTDKNSGYMARIAMAQHAHNPDMRPPCKPGCPICAALWCPQGNTQHFSVDGCPGCSAKDKADRAAAMLTADRIPQTDQKVHLRVQVSDAPQVKQRFDEMREKQTQLEAENQRLKQELEGCRQRRETEHREHRSSSIRQVLGIENDPRNLIDCLRELKADHDAALVKADELRRDRVTLENAQALAVNQFADYRERLKKLLQPTEDEKALQPLELAQWRMTQRREMLDKNEKLEAALLQLDLRVTAIRGALNKAGVPSVVPVEQPSGQSDIERFMATGTATRALSEDERVVELVGMIGRLQQSMQELTERRLADLKEAEAERLAIEKTMRRLEQERDLLGGRLEGATIARNEAQAEAARRYDCHGGPGTTEPACRACVTCLLRNLEAANDRATKAEAESALRYYCGNAPGDGSPKKDCTGCITCLLRELEAVGQKLVDWRIRYVVLVWGPAAAKRMRQPHSDFCIACSHPTHLIAATDNEDPFKPDQTYVLQLLGSRGAVRILNERLRQVKAEGWTPEHDAQHVNGELAMAAACYAAPMPIFVEKGPANGFFSDEASEHYADAWPWEHEADKRKKHSRIHRLEIAGALCAAQLDVLLSEHVRPMSQPCPVCSAEPGKSCENEKHEAAKVPLGEFDDRRSEQKMARLPAQEDDTPDWARSQP